MIDDTPSHSLKGARLLVLIGFIILAAGVGVLSGAASLSAHVALVFAGLAVLAWLWIVWVRPGLALGFWVLAVTNTLPFITSDSFRIPGTLRPEDPLLAILVVGGLLLFASGYRPPTLGRWTVVALWVFASLWALTVLRSWLVEDVPLMKAVLFGRDFLFFGITLVTARMFVTTLATRVEALAVCAFGACVYSAALVAYAVTGVRASWIIHPYQEGIVDGLARPYQASAGLVWLLVLPCLALGLSGSLLKTRLWLAAALVLACGTALGQTRASYLGLLVGLTIVGVFAWRQGAFARHASRLYWYSALIAVCAVVLGAAFYPMVQRPAAAIGQRASSAVATVVGSSADGTSTWAIRQSIATDMLRLLDRDWPWGMGFLHPAVRYFSELPQGTIRNTDLGMMQLLMTMGAVGVVCLLGIIASVLGPVGARLWNSQVSGSVSPRASCDQAMSTGLLASLVGALAASVTLGVFVEAGWAMAAGVMSAMLVVAAPAGRGTRQTPSK